MATIEQYIETVRKERIAQQETWDAADRLMEARSAEQKARDEFERLHHKTRQLWVELTKEQKAEIRRRREW